MIELVTGGARFGELRLAWDALADAQPNPLLRHDWLSACIRAYEPRSKLAVFVAWRDGRIVAAAPFVCDRARGYARLLPLGHQLLEPEGFIFADGEALAEICTAVGGDRRPVIVRRFGAQSAELARLREAQAGRGLRRVQAGSSRTHANPLSSDWTAVEAAMRGKVRRELQRQRQRLEAAGALRFEAWIPNEATLPPLLDAFFQVEGTGWKRRLGTALVQDASQTALFHQYAAAATRQGRLRLFFLRLDDAVIAGQLHVEHDRRLWSLKIGQDEAWSVHSPGALLTHEVLRFGCERGLRSFEHLGQAELWQRRWPAETAEQSSLSFYPFSPHGGLALAGDGLALLARRAKRFDRAAREALQSSRAGNTSVGAESR